MTNNFSDLGVIPAIIEAINEMDFVTPTDVQQEAIPHILKLKDLIVMSKTGSGKTGAFGIPMLQSIDPKGQGVRGLILTPTRELAVQVEQDIRKMSKYLGVRTTAVYGQHDMNGEILALKSASVVSGTPGRVYDHIQRKTFDTRQLEFVVLDEADRMLDMGFLDQVVQIIKQCPSKRVTLLFSATMPPEIKRICQAYMRQPLTIELQSDTMTVDTVKQVYYRVERNEKRTQLNRLLKMENPDRCMIFCNTRDEVDRVQVYLTRKGYVADALHGANTQSKRMKTIQKFKEGTLPILVATDVAARGIHIEDLSLVINYDVPVEKNSYVHRIGRTARAGNSGKAITIATPDDIMSLYEIEEHVGVLLEEMEMPVGSYEVEVDEKDLLPRRAPREHRNEGSRVATHKTGPHKPYQPKSDHKPVAYKPEHRPEHKPTHPTMDPVVSIGQKLAYTKPTYTKPAYTKPAHTKPETNTEQPRTPKVPVKKAEEVTIMTKKYGALTVIYNEKPKEKTNFIKNLKLVTYVTKLFKKEK